MISLPNITEINLAHKRVLIREDFNVPIVQDRIINDRRIQAALPTIEYALSQKASVILLAHRGRPHLNTLKEQYSLAPIANYLSEHLRYPVRFIKDWIDGIDLQPFEIVLCENVRLQPGENTNDKLLAQKIANLADIFVIDAFSVAHRTAASTVGAIQHSKTVCTGLLLLSELENVTHIKNSLSNPFVTLVGGSKTTTKLKALEGLLKQADRLLLGGDIANSFCKAQQLLRHSIDSSDKVMRYIMHLLKKYPSKIHLPSDGIIKTLDNNGNTYYLTKSINELELNDTFSDIGPSTAHQYTQVLADAKSIFWNGPMGIFEESELEKGTKTIVQAISNSSAFSLAGGGDTLAALDKWQLYPRYISTGGGALLEYIAGHPLPAIDALQKKLTS